MNRGAAAALCVQVPCLCRDRFACRLPTEPRVVPSCQFRAAQVRLAFMAVVPPWHWRCTQL